ncbi:MAG: glutamate racemase [Elusimicrobiales bacterium]
MNLKNKAIGIFDSGLGGLTVYREARKLLPYENIIYFGDTMRVPYGNKSTETIKRFAGEITDFFISVGVKMIVVACNTISANAIEVVRRHAGDIDVVGVIEPGVRRALEITKNKKIIVIGTRATINSKAYSMLIKKIEPDACIEEVACPLFVPLVEEGFVNDDVSYMTAKRYLGVYSEKNYDTLILGCTHYPLLKKTIRKVLPSVNIIDSSLSCAFAVKRILEEKGIVNTSKKRGESRFFVSDRPQNFIELSYRLAGVKICKIGIKRF